jgi:tetratricopeptide (TPR) repeat protein
MDQPLRIDLHARCSSDLPSLRPLLDAFRELGEAVELSVAEGLRESERAGLAVGPLACNARLVVDGGGEIPSVSSERVIVLLDTLEPAESMQLTDLVQQADLILAPSQSQADGLASRASTRAVAVGMPRLDSFLSDPVGARGRARQSLGVRPQARLVLWAPRDGTPPWTYGAVALLLGLEATVAILPEGWLPEQIEPLQAQALRRPDLMLVGAEEATAVLEAADLVISNCGELLRQAVALGKPVIRIEGSAAAPRDQALDAAFGEPLWHAEGVKDAVVNAPVGAGSSPPSAPKAWVAEPGGAARRAVRAVLDHLGSREDTPGPAAPEVIASPGPKPTATAEQEPGGFLESIEAQVAFGNVREALEQLEEHLTGWPSARGFTLLASIQRGRNELAGAASAIGRADELARGELGSVLCERARIAIEADRATEARELFAEANALAPALADPFVGLGSLALHQGNAERAQDYFRAALQIEKSARSRAGLGLALATLGRAREAVAEFEAALDLEPDRLVAIHGLVQACFQTGDLQPAEHRVSSYLESHPGNLDIAFTLAGLRSQLGDQPRALEMIERIELFDPRYSGLAELREKIETG